LVGWFFSSLVFAVDWPPGGGCDTQCFFLVPVCDRQTNGQRHMPTPEFQQLHCIVADKSSMIVYKLCFINKDVPSSIFRLSSLFIKHF